MKYLVTGGGGFIGSHLAEHLLERGHEVHVVDDFSTGRPGNVGHLRSHARFRCTPGSVLDYPLMEKLVEASDAIFHLAAAVGVKLIMERPVETLVTNLRGTEIVLELASQDRNKVLVASTSEVYGKAMEVNGKGRLSETDDWTLGPTGKRRWAYGCSKAMDEFMAFAYYDERDLPVVIARFFNTVGPRQTGRYGMVIPRFVKWALENRPILVHGDGEQSRSFTHVRDAVWAIARLMECPEAVGEVFNVGHGEEVTINRLAEKVRELTGSNSEIRHVPYEEVYGEGFEDMRRRTPDVSKLRATIGYEPRHDLEDILNDVIDHFRNKEARDVAWFTEAAERARTAG